MTQLLDIPGFLGMRWEVYLVLLCISIPTYFILLRVFKNNKNSRKYAIVLASAIVLTPILYAGSTNLLIKSISSEPSQEFNQSKWLADKAKRFTMGDDIVKREILLNKDSIQVKELLGDPSSKDSLNTSWIYDMGMGGGGLGFNLHHLYVSFDNNKVVKVEHIRTKD